MAAEEIMWEEEVKTGIPEVMELGEETLSFVGGKLPLANMSRYEMYLFRLSIQHVIRTVNPAIADIIRHWGWWILRLVRAVKAKVKRPFRGPIARGEQLTLIYQTPDLDVFKVAGSTRTTWLADVTAGVDWLISGSGDAAIELDEDEGLVILGWADPIDSPKSYLIQLYKAGDFYIRQPLNWEVCKDFPAIPVKHPRIWMVLPKESYRIKIKYHSSGKDWTQPIAFYVTKAKNLIAEMT